MKMYSVVIQSPHYAYMQSPAVKHLPVEWKKKEKKKRDRQVFVLFQLERLMTGILVAVSPNQKFKSETDVKIHS